ncbi:hypothetical protein THAOC_07408, partial [Thalassiosira oceanica]
MPETLSANQSCVPGNDLTLAYTDLVKVLEASHVDVVTVKMFGMKADLSWGQDMILSVRSHDPKSRILIDFGVSVPSGLMHWPWLGGFVSKNNLPLDPDTGRLVEPHITLSRLFNPKKVNETSVAGECLKAETLPIYMPAQAEFFALGSKERPGNTNDPGFFGTVRLDFCKGVAESLSSGDLSSRKDDDDFNEDDTDSDEDDDSGDELDHPVNNNDSSKEESGSTHLVAIPMKVKVYSNSHHTFVNSVRASDIHNMDKVAKMRRFLANLEKWAHCLINHVNAEYCLRLETTAIIPADFEPDSPFFEDARDMQCAEFFRNFFDTTQQILGCVEYAQLPAKHIGQSMIRVIEYAKSKQVPPSLCAFTGNDKNAVTTEMRNFAYVIAMSCGIGTDKSSKIVARGYSSLSGRNSFLWLLTEVWRHILQRDPYCLANDPFINSKVYPQTPTPETVGQEELRCMADPLIPPGISARRICLYKCPPFLLAQDDLDP